MHSWLTQPERRREARPGTGREAVRTLTGDPMRLDKSCNLVRSRAVLHDLFRQLETSRR